MTRNDFALKERAADIIGLLHATAAARLVFCVDEKIAIHAIDRLDQVLPLSSGRPRKDLD